MADQLEQKGQSSIIQPTDDEAQTLETFVNHVRQAAASSGGDEQRRMVRVLLLALMEGELNGNPAQ